jgi:hypothetical protein
MCVFAAELCYGPRGAITWLHTCCLHQRVDAETQKRVRVVEAAVGRPGLAVSACSASLLGVACCRALVLCCMEHTPHHAFGGFQGSCVCGAVWFGHSPGLALCCALANRFDTL